MTTRTGLKLLPFALLVAVIILTLPSSASAADWRVNIGIGGGRIRPVVVEPAPVFRTTMVKRWVPERQETRTEQVLVDEARYERQWVPGALQTRYDRHGCAYTVRAPGCWREVYIPARYETRSYSVIVPGYWEEVPVEMVVPQPGCHPAPVLVPQPGCQPAPVVVPPPVHHHRISYRRY